MSPRYTGKHAVERPTSGRSFLRAGTVVASGRHRHDRGSRGTGRTLLKATPRVVGAAALVVATTGAVQAGPASTTAGATRVGTATVALPPPAMLERAPRISRDSSRQTLTDITGSDGKLRGGQGKEKNAALAQLASKAQSAVEQVLKNNWQLPIAAGVYHLTAGFGQCSSLWSHCHTGLDFAAPEGTPIHAVAGGVVTETGWAGAYGNRTIITLDDGTELWYCHQSAIGVQQGQQVVSGQEIGLVGSTGNTTGPHLHLEVRPGGGDAVDPKQALIVHGVTP